MTPAQIALGALAAVIALALGVGLFGARRTSGEPADFLVAGRSLGALLLWLLLAGELYTAFTFLGAAGWAYGKGAPVYYVLCYGPVAYVIGYFTMPLAWNVAKRYDLLTIGDLFAVRYRSKWLGGLVAVCGFVFLIPYVTLQMTGLQILLAIAGFGSIDAQGAVLIAVIVIAVFVFLTGLRGTAWTSIVKDGVVLLAVFFAGVVVPIHLFGSPAAVIAEVGRLKPGWLTIDPASPTYNLWWFVSTVVLNAIAFFLFPQTLMSVYSAKSADALRRNYVFLPLYHVMLALMIVAGFTALLVMPGLQGPQADSSFMLVVSQWYPPWLLGVVAGAGCLSALVPVSAHLLGASGLVMKNVVGDLCGWNASPRQRTMVTRVLVIVLAAAAYALWATYKTTLVDLLLIAYNGMAQFVPGAAAAFWWRRATASGVAAGIAVGVGVSIVAVPAHWTGPFGINVGFVALAANAAVAYVVSLLTAPPPADRVTEFCETAVSS